MLETSLVVLLAIIVVAAVGAVLVVRQIARRVLIPARQRAAEIERDAEDHSRIRLKEADLEAEERTAAAEAQFESETRKKRQDLQRVEERVREQERNLQRRLQLLGQKEQDLKTRLEEATGRETRLAESEKKAETLLQERHTSLEKTAGLTAAQARRELVREMPDDTVRNGNGSIPDKPYLLIDPDKKTGRVVVYCYKPKPEFKPILVKRLGGSN